MWVRFVVVGLILTMLVSAMPVDPETSTTRGVSDDQVDHEKPITRYEGSDGYIPHAPVVITSDDDFVAQGWPGLGTPSNPYVIEGLSMVGSPALDISNATVHFRIDSCEILPDPDVWGYTALITSTSNAVFRQCTFGNSTYCALGIYESSADVEGCVFSDMQSALDCNNGGSISVQDCTFQNINSDGVFIYSTQEVEVGNNTFYSVGDEAARIYFCYSVDMRANRIDACGQYDSYHPAVRLAYNGPTTFEYNEVTRCRTGVSVYGCSDASITNNHIDTEEVDLVLYDNRGAELQNNTMARGLQMDVTSRTDSDITMSGNTVAGRPLIFHRGVSDLVLSGAALGQLFLIECDNTTITGCDFADATIGISAAYCTTLNVESAKFSGCDDCINIHGSVDVLVTGLRAQACSRFGTIYDSFGLAVSNSTISAYTDKPYEITLSFDSCHSLRVSDSLFVTNCFQALSIYDCTEVGLYNNIFQGNSSFQSGTLVRISSGYSVVVVNNTLQSGAGYNLNVYEATSLRVENNSMLGGNWGCWFYESHGGLVRGNRIVGAATVGLGVMSTWNMRVEQNEIVDCLGGGIVIDGGNLCSINANMICRNYEAGLTLSPQSALNTVYGNEIGYNGHLGHNNAVDDGFHNEWHLNGIGNCWSDWTEDGPYYVQGSAVSKDESPILLDEDYDHPPLVMMLANATCHVGSEDGLLNWWAFDNNPDEYRIAVDGVTVRIAAWDGFNVTYSLASLSLGRHIVTLTLEDLTGHNAATTVWVEVLQPSVSYDWVASMPISAIAVIGEAALVVLFGYFVRKKAKLEEAAIGKSTDPS